MKLNLKRGTLIPMWCTICIAVIACSLLFAVIYAAVGRVSRDRVPPVIYTDGAPASFSVHADYADFLEGVRAEDDRSGDVTSSLVVESVYGMNESGETTVTYAAFDAAGNVTKLSRSVVLTDYTAPRFSLDEALVYKYGSSFDVIGAVRVSDVIDGDLSKKVKATMLSDASSIAEEGTHEVQFRVTNSIGDTVSVVLPVEIHPADAYTASLSLSQYLVYAVPGQAFDPESYLSSFRARATVVSLKDRIPAGMQLSVEGSVDVEQPGVYQICYTARYSVDGAVYTGYTKLIVIVEDGGDV